MSAQATSVPDVLDPYQGLTILPPDESDAIAVPDGAVRLAAHVGPWEDCETSVLVDVNRAALLAALVPADVLGYLRDLVDVDGGDNAPEGVDVDALATLLGRAL